MGTVGEIFEERCWRSDVGGLISLDGCRRHVFFMMKYVV